MQHVIIFSRVKTIFRKVSKYSQFPVLQKALLRCDYMRRNRNEKAERRVIILLFYEFNKLGLLFENVDVVKRNPYIRS